MIIEKMDTIKLKKFFGNWNFKLLTKIPDSANIKLFNIKNHQEIMYISNPNYKIKIRKLNKDEYIRVDTGELKKFKHNENRKDDLSSVADSVKKLRNLINNNFSGGKKEFMFTVTYKENMKDVKKLYKDFNKFIKRLKYNFSDNNFEYISIVEPQGRGAWHCHVLLKFDKEIIFIENSFIAKLWNKGFVTVQRIKDNIDNIGAYLSAYLTNLEHNDENINMLEKMGVDSKELIFKDIKVNNKDKKFIKGARLYLYPPGMRMFRKSKGIEYPEVIKGKYKEIKKKYNLENPFYVQEINIKDDNKKLITQNLYEQYKVNK